MNTRLICVGLALFGWLAVLEAAEEKAVLEVSPNLAELGEGWTTNVVMYLLDPRSQPPEIDYQHPAKSSLLLAYQRDVMSTNNRTGCGMLMYGHGDLLMNSGLHRVYIQRWTNTRSLHNAWVGWKMNPSRVVRPTPAIGEDYFWIDDWWRRTWVRQNFAFRRGLFSVVVEAGAETDPASMLRLAEVIDAKIRGRPVPKAMAQPPKD